MWSAQRLSTPKRMRLSFFLAITRISFAAASDFPAGSGISPRVVKQDGDWRNQPPSPPLKEWRRRLGQRGGKEDHDGGSCAGRRDTADHSLGIVATRRGF